MKIKHEPSSQARDEDKNIQSGHHNASNQVVTVTQDDMKSFVSTVSMVMNRISGADGKKSYHSPIHSGHLNSLITFMQQVLYTDDLPYRIHERERSEHVRPGRLAHAMRLLPGFARIHDQSLSYSPDLAFFFEEYRRHPISNHAFANWDSDDDYGVAGRFFAEPSLARMANDFILTMRDSAKSCKLKKRISDWMSNGKHNLAFLKKYLDALFERYARILVVDLVFEYHKVQCNNEIEAVERRDALQARANREHEAYLEGTVHHETPNRWVSLAEVKKDWKDLKDNMRGKRTIFRHLIGYVGRIEYSRDAGHHVHVCFLFDGSKVQKDVWLSLLIARYWKDRITKGRGYAFSCNVKAARGEYKNVGVGMIDHYNTAKRGHLWTAVSYFAKATQLVRVKNSGKQKMFLHGQMPDGEARKLGRPRHKGEVAVPA